MTGEVAVDFPEPGGKSNAILTLHSEVATLPVTYANKGVQRVTFRLGLPTEFHDRLKFLVDLGFGNSENIQIEECTTTPRKVLAKMLAQFPSPSGDPNDCEIVRVDIAGTKDGKKKVVRMETTVYSHSRWKFSCGALDTGVPPSIVAQMIGSGLIKQRGVLAPEACVPSKPFFDELARRTIVMRQVTEEQLS
jgi:saccharopine dehydrogenase-like NADP-dependent oxidoreductase